TLAPLAFARATVSSRSGTERASRLRHCYCKPSYRARRLPLERPWPWSGPKRSRTNARGVRGCGLLASAGVGADGHLNAQGQARRITVVLLDKYNPEFDGDRAKG